MICSDRKGPGGGGGIDALDIRHTSDITPISVVSHLCASIGLS